MSDLLDGLDWKPWPKDQAWCYADIPDVARISRKLNSEVYSVRALNKPFRLDGIDRERTLSVVEELMRLGAQDEPDWLDQILGTK